MKRKKNSKIKFQTSIYPLSVSTLQKIQKSYKSTNYVVKKRILSDIQRYLYLNVSETDNTIAPIAPVDEEFEKEVNKLVESNVREMKEVYEKRMKYGDRVEELNGIVEKYEVMKVPEIRDEEVMGKKDKIDEKNERISREIGMINKKYMERSLKKTLKYRDECKDAPVITKQIKQDIKSLNMLKEYNKSLGSRKRKRSLSNNENLVDDRPTKKRKRN